MLMKTTTANISPETALIPLAIAVMPKYQAGTDEEVDIPEPYAAPLRRPAERSDLVLV